MRGKQFVKNAMLLTVTSLLLRTVGMFYRIYISSKIGETGMGLFQMVFSVYMLASAFATAGMSVAVTRLVSEQCATGSLQNIRKIMRVSLFWSAAIGAASALVMAAVAPWVATKVIGDAQMASTLYILCASLPFMACTNCFYGYFLARGQVMNNCVAQVFEQVVRIALVVAVIDRFSTGGSAAGCRAVVLGNTVSEIAAAACIAVCYWIDLRRAPLGTPQKMYSGISGRIFSISLPIAAGRYISTGLHTLENLLVPGRVARYTGSSDTALSQFGALKGMAMPILTFPSAFLHTLSTLLIPEITEAFAKNQWHLIRRLCARALYITFGVSILIGGVFFRFAAPLGQLLYHSEQVSEMLRWLAPIVPFMYIDCMSDGLLKGLGQQVATLRYNTIDSTLRILLVFLLLPLSGIRGFLVIMAISNILISTLNLRRLLQKSKTPFALWRWMLRPLACTVVAHLVTAMLYPRIQSWTALLVGGSIYAGVFFIMFAIAGGLTDSQLRIKKG